MNSRFVFASILKNYQAVVPYTWNAGPRDAHGQRGAYEAALLNTPIADPERPLEVLRTVHSFDPCLACAVHVVDGKGRSYGRDVVAVPEPEGSTSLPPVPAARVL